MATPNQIPPEITTTTGSLFVTNIMTAIRYIIFALGVLSVGATLVKKHDWAGFVAWLQSEQFISLLFVIGGAFSFVIGIFRSNANRQKIDAFKAVLDKLGLDTDAIDPTKAEVPAPPTDQVSLVHQVVAANPDAAADAVQVQQQ